MGEETTCNVCRPLSNTQNPGFRAQIIVLFQKGNSDPRVQRYPAGLAICWRRPPKPAMPSPTDLGGEAVQTWQVGKPQLPDRQWPCRVVSYTPHA